MQPSNPNATTTAAPRDQCGQPPRRGRRTRAVAPLLVVAVLSFPGSSPNAADRPAADATAPAATIRHRIQAHEKSFSLTARQAPLDRLLADIAAQSGLALHLYGVLDHRVSLELHEAPLPVILGRLLRGYNYALEYPDPRGAAPARGRHPGGRLSVFAAPPPDTVAPRPESEWNPGSAHRLADPDPDPRREAIAEVAPDPDPQTLAALATAALRDPDPLVREEAVLALAEIAPENCVPTLGQALDDASPEVRAAAVAGLGEIGDETAIRTLARALEDPDPKIREEVVITLGEFGGDTAGRLLRRAAADTDAAVVETAAEYLRKPPDQPGPPSD